MFKLRVAGGINGFPFRTSLFAWPAHAPSGETGFYLLITRAMLKSAAPAQDQPAHYTRWA